MNQLGNHTCNLLLANIPIVATWSHLFLTWSLFSFTFFFPILECSNNAVSVREREWRKKSKLKLTRGYQLILQSLFINKVSILFIFPYFFLQFPPHMLPVTFHLPFFLFSIIFINKCQIMCLVFSNDFANFLLAIINQMKPTRMFCPTFNLEYVSHGLGLILPLLTLLHGLLIWGYYIIMRGKLQPKTLKLKGIIKNKKAIAMLHSNNVRHYININFTKQLDLFCVPK